MLPLCTVALSVLIISNISLISLNYTLSIPEHSKLVKGGCGIFCLPAAKKNWTQKRLRAQPLEAWNLFKRSLQMPRRRQTCKTHFSAASRRRRNSSATKFAFTSNSCRFFCTSTSKIRPLKYDKSAAMHSPPLTTSVGIRGTSPV